MADKSKEWVIDPVESGSQKSCSGRMVSERTEYSPEAQAPGSEASGSRARVRRESERIDEKGSPILALLAYLAGPYAILTTRRGRESRFWVVLAILSSTMATIIFARASKIFATPRGAGIGFLIWLSVACLAAFIGFAAWARGVLLLGCHKGWLLRRLPQWTRHPGMAGVIGLLIPGSGLFVAEHPRRAACALLMVCAMVVSALILWQAPELWRLSQAGILVGHGDVLERIFLAMGMIGLFGALVWITQALDGARLAGAGTEGPGRPHGDWAVVALVLAIAALLITFKPARVAETIDRFALSMREEGLRVIPLVATQAAMRLDPSRPEYAVRAIELNEALGRPGEALAIRRDLAERWKPYERMLRLEASVTDNAVLRPANP